MTYQLRRTFHFTVTLIFVLIFSCSKNDNNNPNPTSTKLSSCDSIKQGLLKSKSDTIRLISCFQISGCDSIRLGILKPFTSDSIRLAFCLQISGCDSIRLGLLKPLTADTIRLASCLQISGCDSVRLGILKPNKLDSTRLSCLQPSIGKLWGGGIVYYFLTSSDPGYDPKVKHGLIVSEKDIDLTTWESQFSSTGVFDKSIGAGLSNTNKLVKIGGKFAAVSCKGYKGGGFSDWYLPSKNELSQLWFTSNGNGMNGKTYWSSSECSVFEGPGGLYNWYSAWCQDFTKGTSPVPLGAIEQLKIKEFYVRAVRSF